MLFQSQMHQLILPNKADRLAGKKQSCLTLRSKDTFVKVIIGFALECFVGLMPKEITEVQKTESKPMDNVIKILQNNKLECLSLSSLFQLIFASEVPLGVSSFLTQQIFEKYVIFLYFFGVSVKGNLTEGAGLVLLTSSLRWAVL